MYMGNHNWYNYGKTERLTVDVVRIDLPNLHVVNAVQETTSFPGSSPSLPLERERERETLENAGHVSPRICEMRKHNIEGGAGKS